MQAYLHESGVIERLVGTWLQVQGNAQEVGPALNVAYVLEAQRAQGSRQSPLESQMDAPLPGARRNAG